MSTEQTTSSTEQQQQAETVQELRALLSSARARIDDLEKQNNKWKHTASALQAAAEQEEDYISNKLLRRIDEVKAEKARLLQQLERDEQYMADTLQKQLKQLREEKVQLEQTMEHEQEFAINRLRRQLQQLQQHSAATPRSRRNSDADIRREEQLRAALIQEQAVSRRNEETISRLRVDLETERTKNQTLQGKMDLMREANVAMQLSAEQQEEFISNKLLRRISDLKREKEQLLLQVEQEEEHMTNTLSKKVSQLVAEKGALELTLQTEREQMISALREQLAKLSNSSDAGTEELVHSIEIMTDQLRQWQQKYLALEKTKRAETDTLREEIAFLRSENLQLQQTIVRLAPGGGGGGGGGGGSSSSNGGRSRSGSVQGLATTSSPTIKKPTTPLHVGMDFSDGGHSASASHQPLSPTFALVIPHSVAASHQPVMPMINTAHK